MIHTHVYSRYTGQTTETVIKGTTGACPSGHPDCILTPTGSTEVLCFAMSDDDANTTPSEYSEHHTHRYYKMTVLETASVDHAGSGNACPLGHPVCDNFSGSATVTNYPTSVLEVETDTSDAIWDSETEHHHTFLWCEDMSISFWWVGTTTCPLGHSNCKRVTVNDVSGSRDAPDNTPLGEVEGYSTGYWYIWPTDTVVTPPIEVATLTPQAGITEAILWGFLYGVCEGSVGFDYKKSVDSEWTRVSVGTYSGEFAEYVAGLIVATEYDVRAYYIDGDSNEYYGDTLQFTTGTAGYRCYTVRQNDRRGKPIFLAECKAINMDTGALIDTKYTFNGIAVFNNLPGDAPVNVEVRWDKQFRLYQNVYEAGGDEIVGLVSNAHIQNTDDYTNGVQVTTEPATPVEGRWYVG